MTKNIKKHHYVLMIDSVQQEWEELRRGEHAHAFVGPFAADAWSDALISNTGVQERILETRTSGNLIGIITPPQHYEQVRSSLQQYIIAGMAQSCCPE